MTQATPLYPVSLVVADRPCLVVGGGPVATRKVASLLACGARVTVVATGLGKAGAKKAPLTVLRSVTDSGPAAGAPAVHGNTQDYSHLETPAVWRSRDGAAVRATALDELPAERLDIPAFLRKQAD